MVVSERLDRGRPMSGGTIHSRQRLPRLGEEDGDRAQLGDHDDAVGVGAVHDVALVDLTDAGASIERGNNRGIAQLGARHVDGRLILLDLSLELSHQCALSVGLLLRSGVGLNQVLVAFQVDAGVGELGFIQRLLRPRLLKLRLVSGRIDLREEIPFLTSWPSRKATLTSWPSTCVWTVTVLNACTVPTPSR